MGEGSPVEAHTRLDVVHDTPEPGVGASVPLSGVQLPHDRQQSWGQLAGGHSLPPGYVFLTQEDLEVTFRLKRNEDQGMPSGGLRVQRTPVPPASRLAGWHVILGTMVLEAPFLKPACARGDFGWAGTPKQDHRGPLLPDELLEARVRHRAPEPP